MDLARRVRILRRLAVVVVAWTFALMVLGSWVKATGSGLACPDWPTCYGEWLPPFPSDGAMYEGEAVGYTQEQVIYEWAHRLVAALLGIPLLALAILAGTGRGLDPVLRYAPLATLLVLVVQGGIGGATVLKGNPAALTTLHLATATIIFLMLTVAACFAFLRPTRAAVAVTPTAGAAKEPADG